MAKWLVAFVMLLCAGSAQAGFGTPAPDFEFIRTWNMPGSESRFADFRGKPVLLETFATWCPYCPGAVPHLRSAYQQYGPRGLQVISVSDEQSHEIEPYLEQYGVTFPVARAFGVGKLYGDTAVPHSWLIDASGVIKWDGHTNELTNDTIESVLGVSVAPGVNQFTQAPAADAGETWWIWLIVGPAILFMGAMGWFLWQSRDRTANYQTQIYQQPQQARPPGPPPPQAPYGQPAYPPQQYQQQVPMNYGPPQAFPGQPGSTAMHEPFQYGGYHGSPSSVPLTRVVGRPTNVGVDGAMESPGAAGKPEPPPLEQRPYLGQKPAQDFPPFDTNRNPQRGV